MYMHAHEYMVEAKHFHVRVSFYLRQMRSTSPIRGRNIHDVSWRLFYGKQLPWQLARAYYSTIWFS